MNVGILLIYIALMPADPHYQPSHTCHKSSTHNVFCVCFMLQKSVNSMTLDIGEDRILLETRSNVYHLDIYLPYNIIQEECGAQYDRKSKVRGQGGEVG